MYSKYTLSQIITTIFHNLTDFASFCHRKLWLLRRLKIRSQNMFTNAMILTSASMT